MGIVRMGLPQDIVLYLKEIGTIDMIIETGTFKGTTSAWASNHFKFVKTIEFSAEIYKETSKKYANITNIDFLFGDSRIRLRELVDQSNKPIIFWLDAHWCSFGSYGELDQCPLLEELDIILSSSADHVILIDDARLFLCPPPSPNSPNQYPGIIDIMNKLSIRDMYTVVFEDVIIAVPSGTKHNFMAYMQQKVNENQKRLDLMYVKRVRIQKMKDFTKAILWPLRFLWSKS